jgi:protein-disulfide isomerase
MRARLIALAAVSALISGAISGAAYAQGPAPAEAQAKAPAQAQAQTQAQPAPAVKPDVKPAAAPPAAPPAPLPNKWTGPEYVLGSPSAKVTLVEYASASCPHCARFDAQVFPQFKTKYVDTGKVRYVFREFLTEPENVAAIGFLLARCAGHDKYLDVVEQVFRAQPEIYQSQDLKPIFVRIAKANGLSEAQLDACITDKPAIDALNARVDHAANVDKIDSTPTLVANGKALKQPAGKEWDFAALDAQLKPLLAPRHARHHS